MADPDDPGDQSPDRESFSSQPDTDPAYACPNCRVPLATSDAFDDLGEGEYRCPNDECPRDVITGTFENPD